MKKTISLVLALLFCFSSVALAETEIRVPGNGIVYASADVATISLGVSANRSDVKSAQASVNEVLAAIRQIMMENGVSKDAISTTSISLYAMWNENESGEYVYNYTASSNLSIRVTDLENVGKLIDLAFDAGANSLNGVEFGLLDPSFAQEKALRLALQDAEHQAQIIADATRLKITGIEQITENTSYSYMSGVSNYSKMEAASGDEASQTVVQPEQVQIGATVEVVYEAEKTR